MSDLHRSLSNFRYINYAASLLLACSLCACNGSGKSATTPSSASGENAASNSTQSGAYPSVRYVDCPFDTSLSRNELRCGMLDTYENYENTGNDARIIQVAFGIIPAKTQPAEPDPVVVFIGGPGASPLAEFAAYDAIESYTDNRDFILVDQRGTGFSNPFLSCGGSFDRLDDAAHACVDKFEQQGVDLSQYRSAVIAQDFKALRQALEIAKWNVYGVSYGPVPGILYANMDRQGVRSVIFDTSIDNQVDIALADAAAGLDLITELAEQCAAEAVCSEKMPDLRSVYIDNYRALTAEPWLITNQGADEISLNGIDLDDMMGNLAFAPGILEIFAGRNAELMVQLMSKLNARDQEFADSVGGNLELPEDVERRLDADLMHATVQCAAIDATNFFNANLPTRESWPDDFITMARDSVYYPHACTTGIFSIEQDLSQREPINLDVPALILGGALDQIVSIKQVKQLAESFASPKLAIFPRGGHGVGSPLTNNPNTCAKQVVASFIENPINTPDLACEAMEVEPFLFGDELVGSL